MTDSKCVPLITLDSARNTMVDGRILFDHLCSHLKSLLMSDSAKLVFEATGFDFVWQIVTFRRNELQRCHSQRFFKSHLDSLQDALESIGLSLPTELDSGLKRELERVTAVSPVPKKTPMPRQPDVPTKYEIKVRKAALEKQREELLQKLKVCEGKLRRLGHRLDHPDHILSPHAVRLLHAAMRDD